MHTPPQIPKEICLRFEDEALRLRKMGFKRQSSDAILHSIRSDGVKCDNRWTSVLSRWFVSLHPEMYGFFEFRALSDRSDDTNQLSLF